MYCTAAIPQLNMLRIQGNCVHLKAQEKKCMTNTTLIRSKKHHFQVLFFCYEVIAEV